MALATLGLFKSILWDRVSVLDLACNDNLVLNRLILFIDKECRMTDRLYMKTRKQAVKPSPLQWHYWLVLDYLANHTLGREHVSRDNVDSVCLWRVMNG